jgi:hypothetical protein
VLHGERAGGHAHSITRRSVRDRRRGRRQQRPRIYPGDASRLGSRRQQCAPPLVMAPAAFTSTVAAAHTVHGSRGTWLGAHAVGKVIDISDSEVIVSTPPTWRPQRNAGLQIANASRGNRVDSDDRLRLPDRNH